MTNMSNKNHNKKQTSNKSKTLPFITLAVVALAIVVVFIKPKISDGKNTNKIDIKAASTNSNTASSDTY